VLLIDFDDDIEGRTSRFNEAIPEDVKPRVFVIGGKHDPQSLKRSMTISLTEIGKNLAADCDGDTLEYWNHEQLQHNDSERLRLVQTVKPFLFFAGPDAQV
jgi:hypothetical protein